MNILETETEVLLMPKSGENVTIKSIAAELGISFSTVAKALNGDPLISEHTRLMVEEKARQMHYTRNYFARSLRQKDSKTVAVIVNDIDIPAYGEIVGMISGALAPHGYTTMISDSQYNEKFERNSIENVLSRMPEAVIIAPADPMGPNMQLLTPVWQQTLVLGDIQGAAGNCVSVDHRLAGKLSAEHMLKSGNLKNLIFCGPQGYQSSEHYLAGVRDEYANHGVLLDEAMIHRFKPDLQTAYSRFMAVWQAAPGSIDGVICFCDSMALGIYKAARELGLTVGKDISVIGYDDSNANEFTDPPLTSVHLPNELVAEHCVRFILQRLIDGNDQPYSYTLSPYLADRGSVCKK